MLWWISARCRACAAASASVSPCSTTLAPQAAVRVTFVVGVNFGMTIVAAMPSNFACRATAWAWFPADMATTPRARSASLSSASRFAAPRSLNAPVAWRLSSFNTTSAPVAAETTALARLGVRNTRPDRRFAAASMSARVIILSYLTGSTCPLSYRNLMPRISYERSPPGAGTEIESPTFLPISAFASGEEIDSRSALISASCTPTI